MVFTTIWICREMGKIIKLYNTWERVKDIFVKPSLKVYFGKWRNDPNLPVWRSGPQIPLVRWGMLSSKAYMLGDSVMIHSGNTSYKTTNGETQMIKCYEWAPKHKLPDKLKCGDYVWHRNIRKKLKKWHLGWLPPIIKLPVWMKFYMVNLDVVWKTKYDDIRYEFPPQFTVVAFGLSLTFTLHCPSKCEHCSDDQYWESILNYIHTKDCSKKLKKTIELGGIWKELKTDKSYFAVRPQYIQSKYLDEYYAAISELNYNWGTNAI